MKPFAAPVDDILFSLNHVVHASALPTWDTDMAAEIANHFASFAEEVIAPLDETGDREGCRLLNGRVRMPAGFRSAYKEYIEQGWPGLSAPEDFGGQGLGQTYLAMTSEVFSGSNQSLQMVSGLVPGAIRTLMRFGTDDQKACFIPPLVSGEMLATMCLTEPEAGSDLARIRCSARQEETGWRLSGEKIFISGGDQDLSEKILHLVLARTSDNGVKGLSLFLCPCTGEDGTRNTVSVARIEEKMGLHASPTCHMIFDGASAQLIGKEGQGLLAMFTMMNHARTDVALQGVAHAARAFDIARNYTAERVQGRGVTGDAITLNRHADVARMLDEMAGLSFGARAVAHLCCVEIDRGDNQDLIEFLTPIAKFYCTDAGIRASEIAIQALGGYGYLREYRLEQNYRDARIAAIYEGANGIHARMLSTRLLNSKPGEAFEEFLSKETDLANEPDLREVFTLWQRGKEQVLSLNDPTAIAHDFMQLTAQTLLQFLWTRISAASPHYTDPDELLRLSRRARDRGVIRAKNSLALMLV